MSRLSARRREFLQTDPFRAPDTRWIEAAAEVRPTDARQSDLTTLSPSAPDARWAKALALFGSPGVKAKRMPRGLDTETRRVVGYLRKLGGTTHPDDIFEHEKVIRRYPDLLAAHGLHDRDRWEMVRAAVEALLLAGRSFGSIAEQTGFTEEVLTSYESVFFRVRDRLHDKEWILQHVIKQNSSPGDIPSWWKKHAYIGGVDRLNLAMEWTGWAMPPYSLGGLEMKWMGILVWGMPPDMRQRYLDHFDRNQANSSHKSTETLLRRLPAEFSSQLAQFPFCSAMGDR